jgi:aspartyl-tRNA(Asn)/glutamyl-tRNA(Gln) amidotransferase subunit A
MGKSPQPIPQDLAWLGVAEGAALIRERKLSPVEWAQALIDRIDGPGRALDAFIHTAPEQILDGAREAERVSARARELGALHGVPCAVKDIIETADMPTTAHSRLLKNRAPGIDAAVVERLRSAGALILGKTATHEFAHGGPSIDLPWPPARNPWHPDHFPGGSSSGSGVALAGGLAPAALGTDTGGSIRIPAGLCGITGLKPTYGRVSRYGIFPLAPALDTAGPMARSARDCALLLQVLAGHDARDPASAHKSVPNYSAALDGDLRGVRIGVIRHFWETDARVHADAAAAMDRAIEVLTARGAATVNVRLAPLLEYGDVRALVQEAEAFAIYQRVLRDSIDHFGSDFLARILPACLVPAAAQVQASRKRRLLIDQMRAALNDVDALVTIGTGPAARFDAPDTHGALYSLWSDRPNIPAPFSVTGFPTLSLCNGFARNGLPTSMQIAGRPWDEAMVLKVADAFQRETDWHSRHPPDPGPVSPVTLAAPSPAEPVGEDIEQWVTASLRLAQLRLRPEHRALILAAAPRVQRAIERLGTIDNRYSETAGLFSLASAD